MVLLKRLQVDEKPGDNGRETTAKQKEEKSSNPERGKSLFYLIWETKFVD